jgi:hypothetical protein
VLHISPKKIFYSGKDHKIADTQLLTGNTDYQRMFIEAAEEEEWLVAPEVLE